MRAKVQSVHIIGSGLAGTEAALYLAKNGVRVRLFEMRPKRMTAAHQTQNCAELVCSNTFKSLNPTSGPGLLKSELEHLGSEVFASGRIAAVPGGQALAVDRERFSEHLTAKIVNHKNIELVREEVEKPDPDAITLIATGPLTSSPLANWIQGATERGDLYFHDAIAPIVDAATIDSEHTFLQNRYDKGEDLAYLNCPLDENEYDSFVKELRTSERVQTKDFEKEILYQGCQPIEAIADSGVDSLRFGPMKPVGLTDPKTGKRPHAVLQLRPENQSRSAYNLVGFQTKLKYGEQKRIFRMIPALKNAEFLRLGSIHRNTYLDSPRSLRSDLSLKKHFKVYFAGQITGVEGYLESASCGLLAAIFIHQRILGKPHSPPPVTTALGALLHHVLDRSKKDFQPSGIHFGLFEPAMFEGSAGKRKNEMRELIVSTAGKHLRQWWERQDVEQDFTPLRKGLDIRIHSNQAASHQRKDRESNEFLNSLKGRKRSSR